MRTARLCFRSSGIRINVKGLELPVKEKESYLTQLCPSLVRYRNRYSRAYYRWCVSQDVAIGLMVLQPNPKIKLPPRLYC